MEKIVCYSFSFFMEAIILWQYTSTLFVSKRKPWINLTVLSVLYFILFSASLLEYKVLNTALYFLVNFIFLLCNMDLKWYTAFFHSTILMAIMGMCELTAYGIIKPQFFKHNGNFFNLLIFAIFNKLIFYTVIYVLIHFIKPRQKGNNQHDKSVFLLIFIPLTSIFVMLTLMSIGDTATFSPTLSWMITLSAVFLLTSNLLVFGINQYNQKKSLEYTEMQLMLQKESDSAKYYKMLSEQNENQSILIHDIKKHLQSIALLNAQKENDKISAYVNQLMFSSDLRESVRLCDHEMLNAILCRYQRQCEQEHISFHADIRNRTIYFMTNNDITSLFCNLLDNAFDASVHIPESFIEINVEKRNNTPITLITIINSCRTSPFLNQGKNLITHKPDKSKHGFGIKSIRKIVQKYNGNMEMYYNDSSSTFHVIIMLKK